MNEPIISDEVKRDEDAPLLAKTIETPASKDKRSSTICCRNNKCNKKKIIAWSLFGSILGLVALAVIAAACYFFIDEYYYVNIEAIKQDGKIIFSDDFDDIDTFDKNWLCLDGLTTRGGYWRCDQTEIKDSFFTIYADKRDNGYYSAAIHSRHTYGYGYYEVRAKLPPAVGLWGAFWLLYPKYSEAISRDSRISGSEIDVLESPLYPHQNVPHSVHIGGWGKLHQWIQNYRWYFTTLRNTTDIYSTFNTYGVFWNDEIYKFYVNDKCTYTTSYHHNVSDKPVVMIIDLEIAGCDGIPNETPWLGGKLITENDQSIFPVSYSIDYVRIYDLSGFRK